MLSPVRGSCVEGATGVSSPNEKPLNVLSFSPPFRARYRSIMRCWNLSPNTTGLSETVSEPPAMPVS